MAESLVARAKPKNLGSRSVRVASSLMRPTLCYIILLYISPPVLLSLESNFPSVSSLCWHHLLYTL